MARINDGDGDGVGWRKVNISTVSWRTLSCSWVPLIRRARGIDYATLSTSDQWQLSTMGHCFVDRLDHVAKTVPWRWSRCNRGSWTRDNRWGQGYSRVRVVQCPSQKRILSRRRLTRRVLLRKRRRGSGPSQQAQGMCDGRWPEKLLGEPTLPPHPQRRTSRS